MNVLAILFTAFLAVPTAEEEPDHLALAAMMLRDGHPDRAAAALSVNWKMKNLINRDFIFSRVLFRRNNSTDERSKTCNWP